ncbi:hypothetical protein J2X20_000845 [Pelomonas saccharophila]|uniref:Uncharacterized protein n=1 Tax=Roseateles saccharophilus TaxID=304 RepID=A0ABU1YH78_ROSSA|nr:hypothetical protein [Roseateles saccharophilus]MDR7268216.1 hypothetical protein [Roseateles saccharophilus]
MNLESQTSAGQRRAALALHALRPADRNWLLQQLPQSDRRALGELLRELKDLAITPDSGVIRAALAGASSDEGPTVEEARGLCIVLAQEAPVLQSLLLAALPESQREAVLMHWPYELLTRPSPVAAQAWTPSLQDAVMQSWRELALAQGGAAA